MALYEFECPECKNRFERIHPIIGDGETQYCPDCGVVAIRLVSLSSFRLTEPFTIRKHDGTILDKRQTTDKMPPPGYRHENSNLVEV